LSDCVELTVSVADPGFDLGGGVDFANGGGGVIESVDAGKNRELFACVGPICIKMLFNINRERNEPPTGSASEFIHVIIYMILHNTIGMIVHPLFNFSLHQHI